MNLPEPQSVTFTSLFAEIEDGTLKIPQFQRAFVWPRHKSAKLLDSIVKGYPIGTFILWKTTERLRSIRSLGGIGLPDTPAGDAIKYVLDGQQRMTSLFSILKGLTVERAEGTEDYSNVWVDLEAAEDDDIVILDTTGKVEGNLIKLSAMLGGDFAYLASFSPEHQNKIRTYKNRIESYQYSVILLKDATTDVATEVFTRLNVGGEPLSVFEIMVAKTYDAESGFDLAEKFEALREKLEPVEYETIPPSTVLQVLSVLLAKDCRKKTILGLDRTAVISAWKGVEEAIHKSVDYFRDFYRIPASQLLPYSGMLIPFAYFFHRHPDKPVGDRQKFLQDFFWRVSLAGRYSQSLENRVQQDIERMDSIVAGTRPTYDWAVDWSPEFLEANGYFSVSRSFIKALLCVLAAKQPQSPVDNALVRIDNNFLKRANSKNYHHFFPKAWLRKQVPEEPWWRINHIANITLVDDFLNKRLIRAQSPQKYMTQFQKDNPALEKCMKTHLIGLGPRFGVFENDFAVFFQARLRAFSRELEKRIIPDPIDRQVAPTAAQDTTLDEEQEVEDWE